MKRVTMRVSMEEKRRIAERQLVSVRVHSCKKYIEKTYYSRVLGKAW